MRDIPADARKVDLWLPVPDNNPYQKITGLTGDSPYPYKFQSAQYGNVRFTTVHYEHLNAALLDGDGTAAAIKRKLLILTWRAGCG